MKNCYQIIKQGDLRVLRIELPNREENSILEISSLIEKSLLAEIPKNGLARVRLVLNKTNYDIQIGLQLAPSETLIGFCIDQNLEIELSLESKYNINKSNQSYCYFSIFSNESSVKDIITELNINEYKGFSKGDKWESRERKWTNVNILYLHNTDNSINELLWRMSNEIELIKDKLIALKSKYEVSYVIYVVLYLKDNNLSQNIYPPLELLRNCKNIGIRIDYDTYYD